MRELCKKVLETMLNSNVEPIWLDCQSRARQSWITDNIQSKIGRAYLFLDRFQHIKVAKFQHNWIGLHHVAFVILLLCFISFTRQIVGGREMQQEKKVC